MDKGQKGAAGELIVCGHYLAKGYDVFRSQSPTCPFDLLIHKESIITKVEVKTISFTKTDKMPFFAWPRNSKWDILAVVDVYSGKVFEFEPMIFARVATDTVRNYYGFEPARIAN